MFEQDNQDPREIMLEAQRSEFPSAGAAQSYELRYRFPPPADGSVGLLELPEQPTAERPGAPLKPEGVEDGAEQARKGFFRRRPIATVFGLLFLAVAGGAGYLYLDDAAHFESTDDAFIAARQFSVAPQVAGYITAVPVTDNEHVAAGQVIARIDDRDLPRRARTGRGAGRRRTGQRPQR